MTTSTDITADARAELDAPALDTKVLLDRFRIEAGFFEMIESRVNDIAPHLLAGVAYNPLELIGQDLWADITSLGQRQATLCLKHMASMPGAPLREAEYSGSGLSTFEIVSANALANALLAD